MAGASPEYVCWLGTAAGERADAPCRAALGASRIVIPRLAVPRRVRLHVRARAALRVARTLEHGSPIGRYIGLCGTSPVQTSWLLAAIAIAGCYAPRFDDCLVRCAPDRSCPAPFACGDDERCHPPGGGAASCAASAIDGGVTICGGVVCGAPPAVQCAGDAVRTFGEGMCAEGACAFPHEDRACVGGCAEASCTGAWTGFSQTSPPPARSYHTAVWTGGELIVWGGHAAGGPFNNGARYTPSTGQWSATALTGVPRGRGEHSAVWTGTEMIVWAGRDNANKLADGGRYTPSTDTWTLIPDSASAPGFRTGHSAVWTGSRMIVWGGIDYHFNQRDGASFDPSTGTWTPIAPAEQLEARHGHVAVWTGTEMLVWGGYYGLYLGDGAAYNPVTDTWRPISATGAPAPREGAAAVWTGTEMWVWGGNTGALTTADDGARYDPRTDRWRPLPAGPRGRLAHTAAWTGRSVLVWGGRRFNEGPYATGEQFQIYP